MPLLSDQKLIPDSTSLTFVPLEAITATPLRLGLEYWNGLRGSRRFPARAEIKPRDIAPALRHMSLVKVEEDDFIYRIVGDAIVRAYDVPIQNRRVSDIAYDEPGFGAIILPVFRRVAESGEPVAVQGKTGRDVTRVNFTDYENLLLPLGPDDGTVDHIMTFSSYVFRPFMAPLS